MEYRTLSKLKSTYVDALPELIRPDSHRVHTDFNQAITATGRLSSSNPNLQNIPIRTAFSRQIRQAFIPESGWQLVAADYSQIELRILAHLSGEPVLVDTYNNNEDVHALTAKTAAGEGRDYLRRTPFRKNHQLWRHLRHGGQPVCAPRPGSAAPMLRLSSTRYYERYPKVFEYLQQMQREAITQGYVQTIQGRRRYFNFISGSLRALRDTDPAAINLDKLRPDGYDAQLLRQRLTLPFKVPVPTSLKIAMIRLHELLKGYQAHLLLQVHDELIFEVPPRRVGRTGTQNHRHHGICYGLKSAPSRWKPTPVRTGWRRSKLYAQ